MRSIIRGTSAIALILAVVLSASCEDDNNPTNTQTTGSVAGTVTFVGAWPATGDVQVAIYSGLMPPFYIPMGAPDAFTDPVAGDPATYDYSMEGLDPGDYTAIYVSWRDPGNPNSSTLLGMYWANADSVGVAPGPGPTPPVPVEAPMPVTISTSNFDFTNLNIKADLDLVP